MDIGPYRLVRELGSGGMGSVHEAVHTITHRRVALKLLHPQVATVPGVRERFVMEARAACTVDHPNVVEVLDAGVAATGQLYIALELLEGEALDARLERGPLTPDELWLLAEPLLDALQRAHERGIVHRDLKPANVFLARDRSGRLVPKLVDFGIAKLLGADDLALTATGNLLGTPLYLPPEHVAGARGATPLGDVYSFAALCYEALCGRPPFEAATLPQLLLAIASSPVPPLDEHGVPSPVARVVERGLAREPERRWRSAAELAAALREATSASGAVALARTFASEPPSTSKATEPSPTTNVRRWSPGVAATVLLVVAMVAAGWWLSRGEESTADSTRAAARVSSPPIDSAARNATPLEEDVPTGGAEISMQPAESEVRESAPRSPRRAPRGDRPASTSASTHPAPVASSVEPPLAPSVEQPLQTTPTPSALRVEGARTGGLSADEF